MEHQSTGVLYAPMSAVFDPICHSTPIIQYTKTPSLRTARLEDEDEYEGAGDLQHISSKQRYAQDRLANKFL